jgi:hypothetical protein
MKDFTGNPPSLSVADIAAITRNDLLDVSGVPLLSAVETDKHTPFLKEFEFLKKVGEIPAGATSEKLRSSFMNDLLPRLMKNPAQYQLNTFEYAQ